MAVSPTNYFQYTTQPGWDRYWHQDVPCFSPLKEPFVLPITLHSIEMWQLVVANHSGWTNATSVTLHPLMRALWGSRGGHSNHSIESRQVGVTNQSGEHGNQRKAAAASPNIELNKGNTTHCLLLTAFTTQLCNVNTNWIQRCAVEQNLNSEVWNNVKTGLTDKIKIKYLTVDETCATVEIGWKQRSQGSWVAGWHNGCKLALSLTAVRQPVTIVWWLTIP